MELDTPRTPTGDAADRLSDNADHRGSNGASTTAPAGRLSDAELLMDIEQQDAPQPHVADGSAAVDSVSAAGTADAEALLATETPAATSASPDRDHPSSPDSASVQTEDRVDDDAAAQAKSDPDTAPGTDPEDAHAGEHAGDETRDDGDQPVRQLEELAATRATELQDLLPEGSKGRVTMAVGIGRDASDELRTVIGTSEPNGYLRPGVRDAVNREVEEIAPGLSHAERDVLAYMNDNEIQPITVGAGRPICPPCAEAIDDAGATPATELKVT